MKEFKWPLGAESILDDSQHGNGELSLTTRSN